MNLSDIKVGMRVCWYDQYRNTGNVVSVKKNIVSVEDEDLIFRVHYKALRRLVKKPKREFWVRTCHNHDHHLMWEYGKMQQCCDDCKIMRVREVKS